MKHRVLNSGGTILVLMSFFLLATVTAETLEKRERAAKNGVNNEQTAEENKVRKSTALPRQAVGNREGSSNARHIQNPSSGQRKERSGNQSKIKTNETGKTRSLRSAKVQVNRSDRTISGPVPRGQISEPRRYTAQVVNNSSDQASRTDRNRKRAQTDRQTRSSSRVARNQRQRDDDDRDWRNRRDNDDRDWRNRRDDWRRYSNNYRRNRHWVNWYVPISYGGLRYYYSNGAYYHFNGFGFTLVTGYFGNYVYSLPYGYRTVIIDNYPYYHYNNFYYVRDHVRNVYLLVDDPYETVSLWKEEEVAPSYNTAPSGYQELFIYPSAGQTVQEMDQDKYECYLWAVDQTGFDPSLGKPGDFDEYQRAQCACLEGRGYTVK